MRRHPIGRFGASVTGLAGLMEQPSVAHTDPYGAAWLVVLRPDNWNSAKAMLTPGCDVAEPYLKLMQEANFAGCNGAC